MFFYVTSPICFILAVITVYFLTRNDPSNSPDNEPFSSDEKKSENE